jgi:hypothetical protein
MSREMSRIWWWFLISSLQTVVLRANRLTPLARRGVWSAHGILWS